jgi:hypothetical protein
MVPTEGVEPTHSHEYQILSLARLPIPPHRQPIKSMLFAISPLSFFPLFPVVLLCITCGINSLVPRNARNTCQTMASGARFRKYRICSNTLSAITALGKSKLSASRSEEFADNGVDNRAIAAERFFGRNIRRTATMLMEMAF